ncbi:MAG TPA: MarC family protein [Microbacteriaceae bacterium]|nr:MarC family protein [Microbacteriaceae bacterium]
MDGIELAPVDAHLSVTSLVTAGVGLLTITNPLGTLPIFLGLTAGYTPSRQRRTAVFVGLAVAAVLVVALLAGQFLLDVFDIHIDSFKIAGGLLIGAVAWGMVTAKSSSFTTDAAGRSPVVVPLAIPLLAGPGAIALAITFSHSYDNWVEWLVGAGLCILVGVAVAAIYAAGPWIARILTPAGLEVLTRVFGLLLLAIAVQSVLANVFEVIGEHFAVQLTDRA